MIDAYAEKVTFSSTGEQEPTFDIGVSDTDADFELVLSSSLVPANSTLTVELPVDGNQLAVTNAAAGTYDFALDRLADDADPISFEHSGISLADGDTGTFEYGQWTAKDQSIPFATTHEGTDSSQDLDNQAS